MRPIISIIVPCYNQAQYLSECLQSVLEQDYKDWECIIINDGSTDDTEAVAEYWVALDNRFTYFRKQNSGVSDARNFGIKHAKGEYILPLDGDDKIAPQYIKDSLHVLENQSDTKLVYCNTVLFGERNRQIKPTEYKYSELLFNNIIFCSAIFRKADFLNTTGYNPNMVKGLEDWDFWLTFLKEQDKVIRLDKYYFYYRIKQSSRSKSIDDIKNAELLMQIFKNHLPLYLEHVNPIKDHKDAIYYKWALQWVRGGKEYKLGAFIFWPYNYIKRVLWRRKLKQDKL